MKTIILTIFILNSFQLFSQEWHLEQISQESEYPFEYWFSYQHLLDTNSYAIEREKIEGPSLFQGKIVDNRGDSLQYIPIRINNLAVNTSTVLQTDIHGKFSVILEPGQYEIEVSHFLYDQFSIVIELEDKQAQTIILRLGKAPEDGVYQINSKKELSKETIEQIIKCVEQKRPDYNEFCVKGNEYFVLMHS